MVNATAQPSSAQDRAGAYVFRPAFMDEVQVGDTIRTPETNGHGPWEVTGRRMDPMTSKVSLIGLEQGEIARGHLAEGYTLVLRREFAPLPLDLDEIGSNGAGQSHVDMAHAAGEYAESVPTALAEVEAAEQQPDSELADGRSQEKADRQELLADLPARRSRDGHGWREKPDGRGTDELVIIHNAQHEQPDHGLTHTHTTDDEAEAGE